MTGFRALGTRLLRSRIARNVSATMSMQVVQLAVQLASVPILSIRWGLHDYGTWLVLFTFPSYLAMADFGFGAAAANDMTMRTARGDRPGAAATFLALKLIIAAMTATVAIVAAVALYVVVPHALSFAEQATGGHARVTMLIITGYGLAALASNAIGGGYRASDHFAYGAYVSVTVVLLEAVVALGAVLAGGGPLAAALGYLGVRAIGTLVLSGLLRRAAPWLHSRDLREAVAHVRPLIEPALGVLALPAAQATVLQGGVLVIGSAISPAAVPLFTTIRTLTRTALQLTFMVNLSVMPAFSTAVAIGDEQRKAHLVLLSLGTSVVLLLPAAPVLILLGRPIIDIWTRGNVVPPLSLLILMTAAMLLNGAWMPLSNLILAMNRHSRYSYFYLLVSVLGTTLAYVLGRQYGLDGVAVGLIAIEAVMLIWIIRLARSLGMLDTHALRDASNQFLITIGRRSISG